MHRREFLVTLPAAAGILSHTAHGMAQVPARGAAARLEAFDYRGVRLLPSHWERQYRQARDYYQSVSNDDILHGFRAGAGLPAPGRTLGGWAQRTAGGIFGQWLSGMARIYCATGDDAMRQKAVHLFAEWSRALRPDGGAGGHYGYDKTVCGLVDLALYAGHEDTVPVLERITDVASRTLGRENRIADPSHNRNYGGLPWEWYTLSENLYRAYRLTGNPKLRAFAEVWHYPEYWNKFASTAMPEDAHGVHAYSHVNTFCGAAMACEITGDESYLRRARNAYDYFQSTQCYATGGYGPNERFMAPDGSLGRALESRSDTTEIGCGSWAGFKLSQYLMRATGEARYGDWIERLVYNGLGAMLPITGRGRNFYYADYRVGGGVKIYNWDTYTCCSGTYIQNVAAYHDLIYFRDSASLYVNLFLPSEVTWDGPGGRVKVVQDTRYPDSDTTTFTLTMTSPASFPLHFRVPGWSREVSVMVNGAPVSVTARPGTWAAIQRTWNTGDRVEIKIPLVLRMEPVDRQHPNRVAVLRGPVVLVLEGTYHDPNFRLPMRDDDLENWLNPEEWQAPAAYRMPIEESPIPRPTIFRVEPPDGAPVRLRFRPFYDIGEEYPYFIYFDRDRLPWRLW